MDQTATTVEGRAIAEGKSACEIIVGGRHYADFTGTFSLEGQAARENPGGEASVVTMTLVCHWVFDDKSYDPERVVAFARDVFDKVVKYYVRDGAYDMTVDDVLYAIVCRCEQLMALPTLFASFGKIADGIRYHYQESFPKTFSENG